MGFSDSFVRLIDVETGLVTASLQTGRCVTCQASRLNDSEFFITEESEDNSDETTKHYLIRIGRLN